MKPEDISALECWERFSGFVLYDVPQKSDEYMNLRRVYIVGFLECLKIVNDLSKPTDENLYRISKEIKDFLEADFKILLKQKKKRRGK